MSIALAINGNSYTIVTTDCRATTIETKISEFGKYKEDARKTFITSFGWTANAGGNLYAAKLFNQHIRNINVLDSEGIFKVWQLSIFKANEICKDYFDSETHRLAYENSASSKAICSINRFKNGSFDMGIEAYDFLYEIRKLDKNILFVDNPEHKKRVKKAVCKYAKHLNDYKAGRKIVDSLFQIDCDIHKAIYIIACIVDDISKLTDKINNVIDYGISYQISADEVLLMSIHGSAEELKKVYEEKQDYSEQMTVQGNLTEKEDNHAKIQGNIPGNV